MKTTKENREVILQKMADCQENIDRKTKIAEQHKADGATHAHLFDFFVEIFGEQAKLKVFKEMLIQDDTVAPIEQAQNRLDI